MAHLDHCFYLHNVILLRFRQIESRLSQTLSEKLKNFHKDRTHADRMRALHLTIFRIVLKSKTNKIVIYFYLNKINFWISDRFFSSYFRKIILIDITSKTSCPKVCHSCSQRLKMTLKFRFLKHLKMTRENIYFWRHRLWSMSPQSKKIILMCS